MTTKNMKKLPNDIRVFIKKEKSTLAEEVNAILSETNNLTSNEIVTKIFDKATNNNTPKYNDLIKKRMILNFSKDFNAKLLSRLEKYGISREKNVDNVYVYSKN